MEAGKKPGLGERNLSESNDWGSCIELLRIIDKTGLGRKRKQGVTVAGG